MARIPDLYCVEASNDPDTEAPGVCEFFSSKEAALDFAERQMNLFLCVWICVKAGYTNRNGNFKIGYVYFWWTPKTGWGEIPDQGTGYPETAPSTLTYYSEYTPSMIEKERKDREFSMTLRSAKKGGRISVRNARISRRKIY